MRYTVKALPDTAGAEDIQRELNAHAEQGWKFKEIARSSLGRQGLCLIFEEEEHHCSCSGYLSGSGLTIQEGRERARYHTMEDGSAVRRLAIAHRISGIKFNDPGWEVEIPFPKPDSKERRTFRHKRLFVACENALSYLSTSKVGN